MATAPESASADRMLRVRKRSQNRQQRGAFESAISLEGSMRDQPAERSAWLFENYITKKQLATSLGVSVSLVSKLMLDGLPYLKISRAVRYRLSDVEAWLQRRYAS